jgi:hypothetical protein
MTENEKKPDPFYDRTGAGVLAEKIFDWLQLYLSGRRPSMNRLPKRRRRPLGKLSNVKGDGRVL